MNDDQEKRHQERYRAFIEQSAEGVWCFELSEPFSVALPPEDQIDRMYSHALLAECNDACARMYGYDRAAEILGARLITFLPRTEENIAYLREFIVQGYRLSDAESAERDRHGRPKHFLNNLVGIVEDGNLLRAWGTQRDITERKNQEQERERLLGALTDALGEQKRLQEERERAYRGAQEAVRLRDEFLSVAGHELKTPLTALQLQMETIAARAGPLGNEELDFWLDRANRSLGRILRLVEDLLDVTRISTGRVRLELEEVDFAELVRGVVARSEGDAARAKSAITFSAPAPVRGYWDASRLEQIADNLISNAIKYGEGPIEVEVGGAGETATLVVRDHGIGIAPEDQERVFERFERVGPAGQVAGLGLGLWIVREAAGVMLGKISLASRRGEGSEFRVELPRFALRESAG
ncbi:MAG: ATP-binding protein [Thermoanaerobaculia bacterium]